MTGTDLTTRLRSLGLLHVSDCLDDVVSLATKKRMGGKELSAPRGRSCEAAQEAQHQPAIKTLNRTHDVAGRTVLRAPARPRPRSDFRVF